MQLLDLLELESSDVATDDVGDLGLSTQPLFPRPSKQNSREGAKRARARLRAAAHELSDEIASIDQRRGPKLPAHVLDAKRKKASRICAAAGFNRRANRVAS